MSLTTLAERGWFPDRLIRSSIRTRLKTRSAELRGTGSFEDLSPRVAAEHEPIAVCTDEANRQHYEVPSEFFERVLGPHLKYSCCLFDPGVVDLAEAEERMLRLTMERAEIEDGMEILDLGCGWGSMTLSMAERFPNARITALSNSNGQRETISRKAEKRGLRNVRAMTADVSRGWDLGKFDRVVSVEMFEHIRNHAALLRSIAQCLRPEGKLFVHIFCHRERTYLFDAENVRDWMAKHFFAGGMMPSYERLRRFDQDLRIVREWKVSGLHYARTCEEWLKNLDRERDTLLQLFTETYGRKQASLLLGRWRIFFMACAELFAHANGEEWFVGHYLLQHSRD